MDLYTKRYLWIDAFQNSKRLVLSMFHQRLTFNPKQHLGLQANLRIMDEISSLQSKFKYLQMPRYVRTPSLASFTS